MRRACMVTAVVFWAASTSWSASCLTLSALNRRAPARVVARDVAYEPPATADGKQRLDVWAPPGAQDAPVVVFVHGGFWQSGDRQYFEPFTGLYGNLGVALGDHGIVTVLPSYRLFPAVDSVETMLDDVAAAVRFTHDHIAPLGGHPEHIVLAGHSAGGHLVLQLVTNEGALEKRGVDPAWIKGVVPISGIFDVVAASASATAEVRASLWEPLFGTDPTRWSPLQQLSPAVARKTPLLFLVGSDDYPRCLLDFDGARSRLADVMGTSAFFHTVAGNNHSAMVLEAASAADEVTPVLAAFVTRVTTSLPAALPPAP
jgi:acetyl esterase/lipase